MSRGIIAGHGGQYHMTDYRTGIKALAAMGTMILNEFYGNTNLPAGEVKKNVKHFIAGIKKQAKSALIKDFEKTVRS